MESCAIPNWAPSRQKRFAPSCLRSQSEWMLISWRSWLQTSAPKTAPASSNTPVYLRLPQAPPPTLSHASLSYREAQVPVLFLLSSFLLAPTVSGLFWSLSTHFLVPYSIHHLPRPLKYSYVAFPSRHW